ncbi:MAG: hypothetical protein A2Y77_04345 [Planctomycetes bacterium RBG_13_62_9]|nr:MAG: hypothetical protein A2Y77_04345 [Planctomycetes bacterium RBG_13_62_9]
MKKMERIVLVSLRAKLVETQDFASPPCKGETQNLASLQGRCAPRNDILWLILFKPSERENML